MSALACPKCDRAFVLLSPLVRHVHVIHAPARNDQARKVPRKRVKENGKTRTVVPYVATNSTGATGGECRNCPTDPALLPGHPNCRCEPEGGWDDYLATARDDVPENWTKKEWQSYVDTLRKEKVPA